MDLTEEKLLSLEEAAELLGTGVRFLRRLVRRGVSC